VVGEFELVTDGPSDGVEDGDKSLYSLASLRRIGEGPTAFSVSIEDLQEGQINSMSKIFAELTD
jgi:hypothetical protein